MNLLFIDLDATIIDLTGFKGHLFSQIKERYSIPEEKSRAIYDSLKLKDRWPQLFMHKMHDDFSIPLSELQTLFNSCFSKIKIIEPVLKYIRGFSGKKYLFSFGTYEFQMQKINQFQLEKEVDGIFITLEKKIDYLARFVENNSLTVDSKEYSNVTIVDNDETFLKEVNARYPWIKTLNVTDIV